MEFHGFVYVRILHMNLFLKSKPAMMMKKVNPASAHKMEESHPQSYLCPILQTLMLDPVVASDGHTYERQAIQTWFQSHQTLPMTNQRVSLSQQVLIPNHTLRGMIDDYCRGNEMRLKEQQLSGRNRSTTASVAVAFEVDDCNKARKPSSSLIVCASRTSLYSGGGVLVGFEPSLDGNSSEFSLAFSMELKPDRNTSDASLCSLQKIDQNTFVAGTRSGSIQVWSLERNPLTRRVQPHVEWTSSKNVHSQEVTCVTAMQTTNLLFSQSSVVLVASGSRDYTVKFWQKRDDDKKWTHMGEVNHRAEVHCIAGGDHLLSGGSDWNLKLWDVNNCQEEPLMVLEGHSRTVKSVRVSPQSPSVYLSGSEDETVILWDTRQREPLVHKMECQAPVLCVDWAKDASFACAGGGTSMDSFSGGTNMGGFVRLFDPSSVLQILGDASMYNKRQHKDELMMDGKNRLRTAHSLFTSCVRCFTTREGQAGVVSGGGDDKRLRVWITGPLGFGPTLASELGSRDKTIPLGVDGLEVFDM